MRKIDNKVKCINSRMAEENTPYVSLHADEQLCINEKSEITCIFGVEVEFNPRCMKAYGMKEDDLQLDILNHIRNFGVKLDSNSKIWFFKGSDEGRDLSVEVYDVIEASVFGRITIEDLRDLIDGLKDKEASESEYIESTIEMEVLDCVISYRTSALIEEFENAIYLMHKRRETYGLPKIRL